MSDVFRILAEIQLQVAGKPELDKLDAQIKNVTADQKTLNATAAALTKEIAATNSLAQKQVLTTALKNTEAQLAKTTAEAKKLAGVIDQPQKKGGLFDMSSILNVAAGNVAANVLGAVTSAVSNFAGSIVSVTAEFEGYNAQLTTVLGSSEAAARALANITKFASKTPFEVSQLTAAFTRLANSGITPTIKELEKIGDVATSQNKDINQYVEAILDAQTLEFERLKEFGIRASKSGDEVTFSFKNQETTVKATSSAVREYLITLGDLDGISGAAEAKSKTLGGALSNLSDASASLALVIGTKLSPALIDIINGLGKAIGGTVDYVKDIGDINAAMDKLGIKASRYNFTAISKADVKGVLDAAQEIANSDFGLKNEDDIYAKRVAELRKFNLTVLNTTQLTDEKKKIASELINKEITNLQQSYADGVKNILQKQAADEKQIQKEAAAAAQKAAKEKKDAAIRAAAEIKDLQLRTAKDLQSELTKLQSETEQLRTKDGTKTEAQLTKQNQLEATAAKERINTLKKELSDKKALTPELSKLFGDVSGAIDAKFKVKLDIDIDNLRAEIKALQLKISDEITTMQAEARAEQIKIELSTATNDLAGEQKRLALGTELVQAEQAKRLSELQKAGNAKAAEIEKSNLTETQKADAIAQYKAVQAINEQNVIEQSDNEKLALQVAYYEKLAAINIGYLQDITATADEETQAQINALNVQYLQGVLNYEAYKEQLDTLTKERTLAVLGEQRYETEQIIKEKQKEIAAIKAAIDAENFLRVSRGQTPLPLDSKEVQALLDQITELQKKLNEIAGSTTQAEVDIKVSKIEDLNKSVKDATAALDDPTGFLVDKLFGEGIGDAAKEKVVGAINEAFAFGKELAQQIVDEKLASIDSDSDAIQKRIDAELLLKNVNTERVEQERQILENLQNKKEQIQKRQIAANNLQRISTLALATAQAILAINSTAAVSNVASPVVIPLVVAAIGLGIAASLIPILGAGEEGDVSISPSGNRKPKGKSDTMLYWVNPNESIINAKATQKYKPLLEMINSGASESEISKQLNPQEANYNTTANVSYFHKFGVTNTQKGSLNHAITEQINVTIKPLSDSLNEVTKATRRQERQQAQTNEILNDIGELLNAQTSIMKTSKKRTF